MSTEPLSTEARIYARQVCREVKRREAIGAALLHPNATDWSAALHGMMRRYHKIGSPLKRLDLLRRSHDRLEMLDEGDVCVTSQGDFPNRRRGFLGLMTLAEEDHPAVPGGVEHGIVARWHAFEVSRPGDSAIRNMVFAYASEHALGRLWERTWPRATLQEGINLVGYCWLAGWEVGRRQHLLESEITVPIGDDLYATGSTRVDRQVGRSGKLLERAWFDARTVMSRDMLFPRQIAQAEALGAALDCQPTEVAAIARREDFISRLMEAAA